MSTSRLPISLSILAFTCLFTGCIAGPAALGQAGPLPAAPAPPVAPPAAPGQPAAPAPPAAGAVPPASPVSPAAPPATTAPPVTSVQPAMPPANPGILLRLKFVKGEAITYHTSTVMAMTVSTPNGAVPMDMSSGMTIVQRVRSVRSSDGAARVSAETSNMQMSMNGRSVPIQSSALAKVASVQEVIDPRGRISSLSMGSSNPMSSLMSSGQMSSLFSSLSLPAKPVHVGDSWSTHSGSASAGGISYDAQYTVTNAWKENGRQFVSIHSDMTGNMSMQLSQAQTGMTMSGPLTGSSDIIYDATRGMIRQVKGSSDANMSMSFVMPNSPGAGAAAGTRQNMSYDMNMTMTMQFIRVTMP